MFRGKSTVVEMVGVSEFGVAASDHLLVQFIGYGLRFVFLIIKSLDFSISTDS